MRKKLGVGSVKKTYTSNPTYFLVEDRKNLRALDKYRQSRIIKTVQ